MVASRRFAGVERLYGVSSANRIGSAHVVVVGVGGVGSWAVESLARSGVGQLTLIDLDHISESNINRQIHALETTHGQAKVLAMAERIKLINPDCIVNTVEEFVSADNWPALLPDDVTAVIDACDQVWAKTAMAAWALKSQMHFISVGAAGGKRQAQCVRLDDLSRVTHDPLLAKIRYQLRRKFFAAQAGKKIGLVCVFSAESLTLPVENCDLSVDGSLNCSGYGSSVSVTATFGHCAAGWVLNQISEA